MLVAEWTVPPYDVAVSPTGEIYVLGQQNFPRRTVVYRADPATERISLIHEFESPSSAQSVAAGPGGLIYVPDPERQCLWRVDSATGIATVVVDSAVNAVAVDGAGNLWVTQPSMGAPILRMTSDGTVTARIFPSSRFMALAITASRQGSVHVLGQGVNGWDVEWVNAASQTLSRECSTFYSEYVDIAAGPDDAVYVTGFNSTIYSAEVRRCDPRLLIASFGRLVRAQGIAVFDPIEDNTPVIRSTWGRLKSHYR